MTLIIFGFHVQEMIGTIIGYVCGLAMAAAVTESQSKMLLEQQNNKFEGKKEEIVPIGGIIAIGFVIGCFLGIIFCLPFGYPLIAGTFAILGSTLGSTVGCMYKTN